MSELTAFIEHLVHAPLATVVVVEGLVILWLAHRILALNRQLDRVGALLVRACAPDGLTKEELKEGLREMGS